MNKHENYVMHEAACASQLRMLLGGVWASIAHTGMQGVSSGNCPAEVASVKPAEMSKSLCPAMFCLLGIKHSKKQHQVPKRKSCLLAVIGRDKYTDTNEKGKKNEERKDYMQTLYRTNLHWL